MAAANLAVRLGVGDLVDQQQFADQQQGNQGNQQGHGVDPAPQGQHRAKHHDRAEPQSRRQQTQQRVAGEPAGVGEDQGKAGDSDHQYGPAGVPEKIQADGDHQGEGAERGGPHAAGRFRAFPARHRCRRRTVSVG